MKIGVNARTFNVDEPGGAVQASIKHTKGLMDRCDTEVILFGHDSISSSFRDANVVNFGYPIASQAYGLFWERVILPKLVDRYDIDVLYCPNGNAPATQISCPVVLCLHDINAIKGWSSGVHQVYRKLAVPRGVSFADTIVTVSAFSKGEIIRHLDVISSKVEVVHNGVDDLYFSDDGGEFIDLPERYLLFVGSMNPRKNIARVVESYIRLKKQMGFQHKLVIIGPDNKKIFKSIDIDDGDDIITPGFVSKEELKYAYESADVFVFPSLYEGFGLPPLEALACGTPVVTSETTSLGEILCEGAIQVNPKDIIEISDAIESILKDENLSRNLATEGEEYAQKFTWESASDKLYTVLSETV